MALVLKTLRGDEPLDLGSLGIRLLALTFGLDLTTDDVFANIVVLGQAKEPADLGSPLRPEAFRVGDIGQPSDFAIALLDNLEGENSQVHCDDTASN